MASRPANILREYLTRAFYIFFPACNYNDDDARRTAELGIYVSKP